MVSNIFIFNIVFCPVLFLCVLKCLFYFSSIKKVQIVSDYNQTDFHKNRMVRGRMNGNLFYCNLFYQSHTKKICAFRCQHRQKSLIINSYVTALILRKTSRVKNMCKKHRCKPNSIKLLVIHTVISMSHVPGLMFSKIDHSEFF